MPEGSGRWTWLPLLFLSLSWWHVVAAILTGVAFVIATTNYDCATIWCMFCLHVETTVTQLSPVFLHLLLSKSNSPIRRNQNCWLRPSVDQRVSRRCAGSSSQYEPWLHLGVLVFRVQRVQMLSWSELQTTTMNRGSLSTFMLITISYRCDLSSIETLRFFFTAPVQLKRSCYHVAKLTWFPSRHWEVRRCLHIRAVVLIDREDLSYWFWYWEKEHQSWCAVNRKKVDILIILIRRKEKPSDHDKVAQDCTC